MDKNSKLFRLKNDNDSDDVNKKTGEFGKTELNSASRDGDIDKCGDLIRRGADLNITDVYGNTALMRASEYGHYDVASLLCDSGANVHVKSKYGITALMIASLNGHTNIVSLLISAGARIDEVNNDHDTALCYAARRDEYEVCQILITKYGADCTHWRVREYLDKLLVWAAEQDDIKMITTLLEAGARDINYKNSRGQSSVDLILSSDKKDDPVYKKVAFYNAAREKNHDLCEELLDDDADTNLTDKQGLTPLYFVCSDGDNSLVEKMIEKGADVNSEGCLQVALDLYYNNIAKTLLKNGCDVNKVCCNKFFSSII